MMRFGFFALAPAVLLSLLQPAYSADGAVDFRHRISSQAAEPVREDVVEEVRFGREIAARIIGRFSIYDNARLEKYVNLVGHALALNTSRPEIEFHFAVLNTKDVNAYAAPGGYVFVTRGAVEKMQDESELAGVLAHEIMHITEKHVVNELDIRGSDGSAASGLARLIGGGTESARVAFHQAVDKALDMLFTTGYQREDEVRADTGAVLLSMLTGYAPSGLVRYFERIGAAKGKSTEILDKTHPAYNVRIDWLKETITKEGADTASFETFRERFADVQKSIK